VLDERHLARPTYKQIKCLYTQLNIASLGGDTELGHKFRYDFKTWNQRYYNSVIKFDNTFHLPYIHSCL